MIKKNYKNLEGQQIDRLTIIEYLGFYSINGKRKKHWFKCKCKCGKEIIKNNYYLLYAKITNKSCGCYNSERTIKFNKTTKTGFTNKWYKKENYYYIEIIKNSKKYETIIDKETFLYLKKKNRKLSIDGRGYAFITKEDSNSRQMFLHNLIIYGEEYYNSTKSNKLLIDHINNNILDNRKINLRFANDFENTQNAKIRKDNTCGIKGFTIHKKSDRPTPYIIVRVQAYKHRYRKSFKLSLSGLRQAIIWNYNTRKELHNDFANFGFDIHNKTLSDIIEEQSQIFINNLNDYYKDIFYNDGHIHNKIKNK